MGKCQYYHYFVEGDDEEKIVNTLKSELQLIKAGKTQKFNIIEQKLTNPRIMPLKKGTTVVLIFDTDTEKKTTLLENLKFLQRASNVSGVLCITQVKNLEDELKRSCNLKRIKDLTGSKSDKDFKRDLIKINNLDQRLHKYGFDINKFWSENDKEKYPEIKNEAYKIKL